MDDQTRERLAEAAMSTYSAHQLQETRRLAVKALGRARILLGIGIALLAAGLYRAVPKLIVNPIDFGSVLLVAAVTLNLISAWQRYRSARLAAGQFGASAA